VSDAMIQEFYQKTVSGSGGLPPKGIIMDLVIKHFLGTFDANTKSFTRTSTYKGPPPQLPGKKDLPPAMELLKEQMKSPAFVTKGGPVLNEYYTSASFVQVSQAPELGGAQTDIGSTITSMLEAAEEEFAKLLAETEAAEAAALNAYEKLSQDNKVSKTTKQGDVKGKTAEVKQIEVALSNYKEDHATLSDELSAVLTYLDKLKPQCETKVMSYAERKARREEEISGLKEALAILSDESFVQVSTSLRGTRRA